MNDSTLDAVWGWDSETGEKILIDRRTGQIIVRGELKDVVLEIHIIGYKFPI